MSKTIFIKLIISIILLTLFFVPSTYAIGEDIFSQGRDFLDTPGSNNIDETINVEALQETSDYIYNMLFGIATMVAIIVAMILGIQFMAASADEKAKVKEALIPFIVGCIVVFGSFTIWKILVNMGNDAEDSIAYSSLTSNEFIYENKEFNIRGNDILKV